MASEPIPEPLTNQSVDEERESRLPTRTSLGDESKPLNAAASRPPNDSSRPESVTALNRAAENAGTAIGNLVNRARDVSGRSKSAAVGLRENTKNKLAEIRQQTAEALDAAQLTAAASLEQAQQQVSESVETARLNVSDKLQRARLHARRLAHDYPLQIIAAGAALGFLAGVLLRLWRSSRYE